MLILCLLVFAACSVPQSGAPDASAYTSQSAVPNRTSVTASPTHRLPFLSPIGIPTAPAETPLFPRPTASQELLSSTAAMQPSEMPAGFPRLATPASPRTLYGFQVVLDYDRHSLEVEQEITYTNSTPVKLAALPLVVEARRYPHAFQLINVRDSRGERFSDFQWKDTLLSLAIPGALEPGDTTRFTLTYLLRLPDLAALANTRPHPLAYNSQQANLGDWYPFVPPYLPGEGWLAHPPAMYGEHLVYDIADYEVAIRFTDPAADLVVAASAPFVREGEWLRFRHAAARSFAWSVSPYYQQASQIVRLPGGQDVEVTSYYFAFHEAAGKALLESISQALLLYSSLFGAYAHPALAGVQAGFMDGMEYDGLFFLSTDFYNWFKDPPADFLVALAAHEVAHQWWLGLVGSDQALQPWLDEALCTYSERIFYENLFPAALDWWWEYRVNYYQPAGWVDISVYDVPQEYGYYRRYRDPIYLRGAAFLEELRVLIGDEAFFASLRQYAARYAYQRATAAGFFEILDQNTATDLAPLLAKYFKSTYIH